MFRHGAVTLVLLLVLTAVLRPPIALAAGTCDTPGTPTQVVYLPNVTKTLGGTNGWVTPFIVQNVGTSATTLEVSFFAFSDGSPVTCRKITQLQAGTSFADVPNNDADLPDNSQFSVVVRSFGTPVVSVVNEHQGSGSRAEALSYVGLAAGSTTLALPYVAKLVDGWLTTFIIQNVGASAAAVTAAFRPATGAAVQLTRTIGPGRSAVVDPSVEPTLRTGLEYAVLLTSDQPIAAVVNAHNDGPTVSAPRGFSYNGTVPVATDLYLPYVARNAAGVGRSSRILVQNTGGADATPTLTFRRLDRGGTAVAMRAPDPLPPGAVWSFDPGLASDGTTCPVQGSATCIAEGEHSAVVSGGTFAVLNALLSTATAMGYMARPAAPSRMYLPNVTRTLGGANGWTTPIVLQSAGTAAATLRWYRFADGSLAQTQSVSGLLPGLGLVVDPRTVSGLSDDAQYAVVVDAPGPIVAIVMELAFQGGDGAMIYEGFAGADGGATVATTLAVSPTTVTLDRRGSQQFSATLLDQFGRPTAGQGVTWSVSAGDLGTVSSTGTFTASYPGTVTVRASAGTVSGTATLTIRPPTYTFAYVALTPQGLSMDAPSLTNIESHRRAFPQEFATATRGLALADVGSGTLSLEVSPTVMSKGADDKWAIDQAGLLAAFYAKYTDAYDYLVFGTPPGGTVQGANGYHSNIRWDSQGLAPTSARLVPHVYTTTTRRALGFTVLTPTWWYPDDAGAHELHEFMHEFCCYLYLHGDRIPSTCCPAPGDVGAAISDNGHWLRWFDVGATTMDHQWADSRVVDLGNGTYRAESTWTGFNRTWLYSDLELYLLGVLPASAVRPMTLLVMDPVPSCLCVTSGSVYRASKRTVTIDDIVAVNGRRPVPAAP